MMQKLSNFSNWINQFFKPELANITVSTAFDNNYLDYGKILLKSILKNSPDVKIKVLVVNTKKEDLSEFLPCKNIEIIYENIDFIHPYEQRLYVMARRIFFVNQLRHDPSIDNLLQLDADLIVRKDLNYFGKLFKAGDFIIFARPNMRYEKLRLTMAVVGLKNSQNAKDLTQEWVTQFKLFPQESLESLERKYIDQITLWKAYEKVSQQEGFKLVNLGEPYIGEKGDAIIRYFYATKGAKGNQQLIQELNQYADYTLADAPSNAPPPPQEIDVLLRKELLY